MDWISVSAFFSFKLHKLIHVASAILFLGNVMVGPLWVNFAKSTKNQDTLLFAFKILVFTDVSITIPFYDLTILNGLILGELYGGYQLQWLNHTIYDLLVFSVILIPVVILQNRVYELLKAGRDIDNLYKWWSIVGMISSIPILHIVYTMVFKG